MRKSREVTLAPDLVDRVLAKLGFSNRPRPDLRFDPGLAVMLLRHRIRRIGPRAGLHAALLALLRTLPFLAAIDL